MTAIADWVAPFHCVADIGAGAGRLSKLLTRRGHEVWATEFGTGSLEMLTRGVAGESVIVNAGDGLWAIRGLSVDAVVIAGMGARRIGRILDQRDILPNRPVFFVQPMQGLLWMHRYILDNRGDVQRARLVRDRARLYPVWQVRFEPAEEEQPLPLDTGRAHLMLREFAQDPWFSAVIQREIDRRLTRIGHNPGAPEAIRLSQEVGWLRQSLEARDNA